MALTITTGFTAGLEVIHLAKQVIQSKKAKLILAGGVEEEQEELLQSFATYIGSDNNPCFFLA